MFLGMPEIEDALGQGKVLAKELLETHAAIGDRELLFGLVPADLSRLPSQLESQFVQHVKTSQIPHFVWLFGSWVMHAADVVEHADVRHAAVGSSAVLTLLT